MVCNARNGVDFAIFLTCLMIGAFSIIRQEVPMTEERVSPLAPMISVRYT